jgi:hypothetical protein
LRLLQLLIAGVHLTMDPATRRLLERYFLLDSLPLIVTLAANQPSGEPQLP